MEAFEAKNTKETATPRRIGGWLILVGIGVVFTPLKIIFLLSTTYPPLFSDGAWEAITTVGSEAYSPIWGPLIIGEVA